MKLLPSKDFTKSNVPVEFYFTDAISNELFSLWWKYHSPASSSINAHNVFVFPRVSTKHRLDFTKPFDYENHKEACKLCAEMLDLQISAEFRDGLGANSVRRGNAAKVVQEMRGAAPTDPLCIGICIYHKSKIQDSVSIRIQLQTSFENFRGITTKSMVFLHP